MILQAILLCYSPNDFTGIANGNTVCRYIFGYYTPGSNYAIIADGNSRTYGHARTDPNAFSDSHRPGLNHKLLRSVIIQHRQAFISDQRMLRGNDRYIRTDIAIIPYGYRPIILNDQIKIEPAVLSYFSMTAVMYKDRTKHTAAVTELGE